MGFEFESTAADPRRDAEARRRRMVLAEQIERLEAELDLDGTPI